MKAFSLFRHIPHYSRALFESLTNPLLIYLTIAGNSITLGCVLAFYAVEHQVNTQVNSLFDALWWAMSTVSTVGFGDVVPVTTKGKLIAIFLMITGLIIFVSFTTVLVSTLFALTTRNLLDTEDDTKREIRDLTQQIQELKKLIESKQGKI